MYKNTKKLGVPKPLYHKILLIMRLTTVLLIASLMQVSAAGFAQRITLKQSNATLESVMKEIRKQTGYDYYYDTKIISATQKVNVSIRNASLEDALNNVLKDLPLDYEIEGKTISIHKKDRYFLERLAALFANIDIRGRVLDEKGLPLPGATVRVKNTNRLVITNAQGEFSFNGIEEKAILIISYLGYKSVEVNAKTELTVSIQPQNSELNEIMISTGYQKIKKDQLTGAASIVTEKQYQQREAVTGNFLESLEGKVPGLVYNGQTGELTIRGVSTFDAVKQPLIVLDGFPTEIDLRTVNPNDIISVSVLRDAAAAAIYGVRASNGVIVVETRRGKSGKPVIQLSSTIAMQIKPDFGYLNYMPAAEFVRLQRDYFYIAKPSSFLYDYGIYKKNPVEQILFDGPYEGAANPTLTQEQVNQKLQELGSYDNLSEYEKLFYRNSQKRNINLDVSGGSEKSTYVLGFNYVGESPVTRRTESNRFSLNLANTFKLSDRFNFDFSGNYTNGVSTSGNTPGYGDFNPYEHLADAQGNPLPVALDPGRDFLSRVVYPEQNKALMELGLYDQQYYPYGEMTENKNTVSNSSVRFQGRLNARITGWLNMDVGGNYENQHLNSDRLQMENSFATRTLSNAMALKDDEIGNAVFANLPQGDILIRNMQKISNYTLRAQFNFAHKFDGGKHDLSGIAGAEQKKTVNPGYTTTLFGYDPETLISKPANLQALNSTSSPAFSEFGYYTSFRSTDYFNETEVDRRFMSYYGQGTYIFNSKYVATGSFRIDKSNLFGVDPKYRNKPLWSAGLSWRLAEEQFIKPLVWIDQLQLRVATGFNGNVPSSNNGSFLILNTGLNTSLDVPLTFNDILSPENQSIRWETTRNYNLGLDYALFNDRISGSLDWYNKRSTDVFGEFDADPTSGFNQYNANTSTISNKGFEVMVNTVNLKSSRFSWLTQLTASFNQNKVLAVKATEYDNSQLITSGTNAVAGLPIGALFSYNYGGLNDIGQPFVYDRNGNEKVLAFYGNKQVDVEQADLIYNGTTTPKYALGFNNQFMLGNFDLSFLFMYYGGHVMRVEPPDPNLVTSFSGQTPLKGATNFWQQSGDQERTRIPGFSPFSSAKPGSYQTYALYGYTYASEFVRKADYIRLRDVVVTYHPTAHFLHKAGLRNVQLRLQAQNPFRYTFSGNDIDPDAIDRRSGIRRLETQPLYSLTFSTNF